MFTTIEEVNYAENEVVLAEMFRLRKRVFHDVLGWDVPVKGDQERDFYGSLGPVYLVWCDPELQVLYASLRLMPTTGPTLLSDVFSDTMPNAAAFSAPGIWEATRSCVDVESLARDFPSLSPGKAFGLLLLATVECCLAHGIETVVANYEPRVKRIYERSSAIFDEVGRADGYGKFPVCCGAFEISERAVSRMRERLGFSEPVFTPYSATPRQLAA